MELPYLVFLFTFVSRKICMPAVKVAVNAFRYTVCVPVFWILVM